MTKFLTLKPFKSKSIFYREGDILEASKMESVKPLLDGGYLLPVKDAIGNEFKAWCKWLQEYPIFMPDLKQANKGMYAELVRLNKQIDKAGLAGDYRGFNWAISAYKRYHLQCLEANSNLLELWG